LGEGGCLFFPYLFKRPKRAEVSYQVILRRGVREVPHKEPASSLDHIRGGLSVLKTCWSGLGNFQDRYGICPGLFIRPGGGSWNLTQRLIGGGGGPLSGEVWVIGIDEVQQSICT
jgi:hypothetical protein